MAGCDRFSVYRCELTGRDLCGHHRTHCDQPGCDHTVTYRCRGCGRALCNVHRHHGNPPPHWADVETAKVIRGTTLCQSCAPRYASA